MQHKRTWPHQAELARYLSLPKDFVGSHETDDLFKVYEGLKHKTDSSAYLFAAGSAAMESALLSTDTDPWTRHHRLDCANEIWQDAQYAFINKHLFDGWSEAKLYALPNRIEMSRIFIPLFHDMIDGNVQQETLDNTHRLLAILGMENLRQHDIAELAGDSAIYVRRGLGYELGSIMAITRLKCPSFFAIPAIVRADHGKVFPEDTHDVRLIRQSWGTIEDCVPYEVKPCDGLTRDRYKSAFIRGHIELQLPSSTNPLEMARHLHMEELGTITAEQKAELDMITSRVLRQAEDYKNAMSLGQLAAS